MQRVTLKDTEMPTKQRIHGTTILAVRRAGKVVMAGDGQVTLGSEVLPQERSFLDILKDVLGG